MDILIDKKNQVPPLLQKPNSVVPLDFKMFKFCFGRLPYLVHVSRMGWLLTKRVRIWSVPTPAVTRSLFFRTLFSRTLFGCNWGKFENKPTISNFWGLIVNTARTGWFRISPLLSWLGSFMATSFPARWPFRRDLSGFNPTWDDGLKPPALIFFSLVVDWLSRKTMVIEWLTSCCRTTRFWVYPHYRILSS